MAKNAKARQSQSHTRPHQNSAEHDKRNMPSSASETDIVEAKIPPNLLEKNAATNKEKDARDKKRFGIELATLIFVIIYALLTAFIAAINYGQLRESRRVTSATIQNFEKGQRAWIGLSSSDIMPPAPGVPLQWHMIYKNFGNSPATQVQIRVNTKYIEAPFINEVDFAFLIAGIDKKPVTTPMFNGQTYPTSGMMYFAPNAEQVHRILVGKSIVVYVAEITYRDIFDQTHETRICQVWEPVLRQTKSCGVGELAN